MIASTELLLEILQMNNKKKISKELRKKFLWFKSPGRKKDKQVLFTGYFEPLFQGSLVSSDIHDIPIYAIPKDLKILDLGKFRKNLKNLTIVYRLNEELEIVPYYTREQIMEGKLKNSAEPIAWLSDITDLFFLQIQGSGLIETPDGSLVRIGYSGANGRAYSSIGKILIEDNLIPKSEMSMQAIRNYLKENPFEKFSLLNFNDSYVFFSLAEY